jgi:hypothetical protein
MKRSTHKTLLITALIILIVSSSVMAQSAYTLSGNTNWSAVLPSTCYECTITIAAGSTLTVDESATCQNCTFDGGTVSIGGQTLNIQYAGSQTTTYFNGTNLQVSGSGKVIVNAPLSLTNSIFTFNNTSSLTTSYNVALSASTIYLYDNSSMTSTGGASTTISLVSSSRIVIGNGSTTSSSIFTVSGPTLNVYDNSSVAVGNDNNVYYNWADYNYQHNSNANSNSAKAYASSGLGMNCGSGYPHACSNPSLYGPATLSSSGVVSGNTLPVVLTDFSAVLNSDHSVTLSWNTQEEINFSHFTIQRSADGENWDAIGTVQAKGNSAVQTDYSFTDEQPVSGTNYYRLALVNLDNSYSYTEVKVVRTSAIAQISFFPNPARDYVNISLGGVSGSQVTVLLTGAAGQLLQEKKVVTGSGSVVTFPVQNIAAGVYILSVINADGSRESSPVLISK